MDDNKAGKIIYLGHNSFQVQFNNENLIIDPYLKWLHTKDLLNKDDPLSFTLTDNLKHKFRSAQAKELTSLVDEMDYVIITSPNYSQVEQLREMMEKNPNLLIVGPRPLIHKIKASLKKKIPRGVDFISLNNGEKIKFTHFEISAIPTEKDRFLMNMITDKEKNSLSLIIKCGQLRLYYSGVGVGKPLGLDQINMALLPMSYSLYNNLEELMDFYKMFKPKLIIPYMYNSKVYNEIIQNQDRFDKKFRVYFPRIGLPLQWN